MDIKDKNLVQGIDTVIVRVNDLEQSMAWYQDKLGFTTVWSDQQMKLVILDTRGAVSITLWQTDQKIESHKDTASFPIFKTPDVNSLYEHMKSQGVVVEPIIRDEYVAYFVFYDPDGNILEACQALN